MGKSVRFANPFTLVVIAKEVQCRIDRSGDDEYYPVAASWYLPLEYQQILLSMQLEMQQCRKQQQFHNKYQSHHHYQQPQQEEQRMVEDTSYCSRGLPTARQLERRSRDTQRSIQAVLNEQDRQRNMRRSSLSSTATATSSSKTTNNDAKGCCFDPNLLAEVYRGYCLHCQLDAERLGRQDAMAATKIYQEEEENDDSSRTTSAMEPPTNDDRVTGTTNTKTISARIEITRRSKSQSPPLS